MYLACINNWNDYFNGNITIWEKGDYSEKWQPTRLLETPPFIKKFSKMHTPTFIRTPRLFGTEE